MVGSGLAPEVNPSMSGLSLTLSYSGRYTRIASEHLQHAVQALLHEMGRCVSQDETEQTKAVAVVGSAKQALMSRVAEAIRRNEAELEALAAGVRAEVYRCAAVAA
eukprot:GHVR01007395.1.p1 GENE.GHVR01007395.1~~GHVR01007395.1.p1  ORF type:complete len:106 (+),score=17.88 GHVR01007395.1:458-775(+)